MADADFGSPCRVSLEDAAVGETLILLNHVSNDVDGPYRAMHAILVREQADDAAPLVGRTPPVFARRTLSLRAFDANGDLAPRALPGRASTTGRSANCSPTRKSTTSTRITPGTAVFRRASIAIWRPHDDRCR